MHYFEKFYTLHRNRRKAVMGKMRDRFNDPRKDS